MPQTSAAILILLSSLAACTVGRRLPPEAVHVPDSALSARIDAFLKPYVSQGLWSGSVVVVRHDAVLHRAGYGLASVEHGVPNAPETRFGVASVTKGFTAIAAARLAAQGVIDRGATIQRWMPGFPAADRITIDHLIRHRSGIRDTDALPWMKLGQRFPHPLSELADSLASAGLEFEPGTRYKYSNGGYTVLAAILSAATGLSFPEVLERWVFGPAGMSGSGDLTQAVAIRQLASGYVLGVAGELAVGPLVDPTSKVGAGSAFTTVDDVVALYRALRDGRLFPSRTRDSLFRPIESPIGPRRIYFGGRGPSYTAAIQIFLEQDVLIAALGNNYGRLNEEITDGIAGLVFGRWTDDRVGTILARELPFTGVRLSAPLLDSLAGRYRHQWGFEFELEHANGQLVYVFPEHGLRTPIFTLSDTLAISPWQWAELRWDSGWNLSWRWLDFPGQLQKVERLGSRDLNGASDRR